MNTIDNVIGGWQGGAAIAGNGKARVKTHEVSCSLYIACWIGGNDTGGVEVFTRVGDFSGDLDIISKVKLTVNHVVNYTIPNNRSGSKLGKFG